VPKIALLSLRTTVAATPVKVFAFEREIFLGAYFRAEKGRA